MTHRTGPVFSAWRRLTRCPGWRGCTWPRSPRRIAPTGPVATVEVPGAAVARRARACEQAALHVRPGRRARWRRARALGRAEQDLRAATRAAPRPRPAPDPPWRDASSSTVLFGDAKSPSHGFYEAHGAERSVDERGIFHGSHGERDLQALMALPPSHRRSSPSQVLRPKQRLQLLELIGRLPVEACRGDRFNGGVTWRPSINVDSDVHEVRAHPRRPGVVMAAAAVGLGEAFWRMLQTSQVAEACRSASNSRSIL